MLQRYVAKLYWEGRDEALDRLVHQTHMLLTSMRGINAGFAGWQRCDRRGENVAPVAGKPDVEQAIVDNEVSWRTGSTERTAYQPRFFIGEEARPTAEVKVTCGIELLEGLRGVFVPNRCEFDIHVGAAEDGLSPKIVEKLLRAAVNCFRPDFGYAGSHDHPLPPVPLMSEGKPPVGWMTYLSARFPPLPTKFEKPSVIHAIGSHGHLIVAHPKLFDDADSEQAEAIAKVKAALEEVDALIGAAVLAGR